MRALALLSVLCAVALGAFRFCPDAAAQTTEGKEVVQNGSQVGFEYTLRGEDNLQIESNRGQGPMTYTHGQGEIIPGLENKIEGMAVGEEKTIRVKPEDAYGPVNPGAFREIPKESLPQGLEVGMTLLAQSPQGQSRRVRVREIREETAVLDFNHPLAGKTLTFEIKILSIQAGKEQ